MKWAVVAVEVRPTLLSGEAERFLLEDVSQVGYRVVTPGRQNIGNVRGFSFNINSVAVESLELDSFGISIIPSSLVRITGTLQWISCNAKDFDDFLLEPHQKRMLVQYQFSSLATDVG
ncbi:hypothetical protein Tsubulata_030416 [Turnera subulata]|uniref:Uncharacterized protein n=1 Tax=Turnera subulata TaxID=218843 RepID=A0A9Q0JF74_9ROSI|nr:hypothetical protein Tsubulata_030416 [Turnera subulata]